MVLGWLCTHVAITHHSSGQKLQQAHDQQQFDRAVKDMEIWLDEVDKQLETDELGRVSNFLKLIKCVTVFITMIGFGGS